MAILTKIERDTLKQFAGIAGTVVKTSMSALDKAEEAAEKVGYLEKATGQQFAIQDERAAVIEEKVTDLEEKVSRLAIDGKSVEKRTRGTHRPVEVQKFLYDNCRQADFVSIKESFENVFPSERELSYADYNNYGGNAYIFYTKLNNSNSIKNEFTFNASTDLN